MIKGRLKGVAKAAALCVTALCVAAEPLVWERRPNRPAPAQFDTFHGQTLDLSCRFEGFGELPFAESGVNLYWQTNGMGDAWWSMPATVNSNTVSASWLPRHDPGAGRVKFFFGAQSNAYASAVVRLLPSPGFVPVVQPLPDVAFNAALVGSIVTNIAKEIMNAAASPPLRELVPDITDATVTLAPVDGAANWVDGIVQGLKYTEPTREFQRAYILMAFQDVDSGDLVHAELALEKEDVTNYSVLYPDQRVAVDFRLSRAVSVLRSSDQSELTTLPEGTSFEMLFLEMEDNADFVNQGSFTWHDGVGEHSYISYPSGAPTVDVDGILLQAPDNFYYADVRQAVSNPRKSPIITLPTSADAAKARWFSLALETDADSEKEVTWQGGEVIEALPGASKLVPGLNVWDVAEVAPGKFKVERASSPAQSAPLTLTAPNGRVAELTVDDDLVLEVKEK